MTIYHFHLNSTASNQAPTFSPALVSKSVIEGLSLIYTIGATDPEGQLVTITFNPTGTQASFITFNSATKTFTFTPQLGDAGTQSVSVTASDGSLSTTSSFTLTIVANTAPYFNAALVD
jgi:trimeric autotransporter adhesin